MGADVLAEVGWFGLTLLLVVVLGYFGLLAWFCIDTIKRGRHG